MSRHHDVPADIDPDTLDDLIADAQWLVAAAPPVRLRAGAFVGRPATMLDITDVAVRAADGYGG